MFRFGIGIFTDAIKQNQNLILGSVKIPFDHNPRNHNTSDVLEHAIIDALLGALALGNMEQTFPENDDRYKNTSSQGLLEHTYDLIKQEGYKLNNLDCVLILKKPDISPYIEVIRKTVADIFWCDIRQISIKTTKPNILNQSEQEKGISAIVMVSLKKRRGK